LGSDWINRDLKTQRFKAGESDLKTGYCNRSAGKRQQYCAKTNLLNGIDNQTSGRTVRQKNKPTEKPVHYCPCCPTKPVSAGKERDGQCECRGGHSQIDMWHTPLRRAAETDCSEKKENASQNCKWVGKICVD
jgi:hypothetical protein